MKRRHALKSLTVAGGLSLAGCSSVLGSGSRGTVLGRIEVINFSVVPNRIHLTVSRGDEVLLERTIGLTAIDAEDSAAWTIIEPLWVQTEVQSTPQGEYTIHTIHVGEDGDRESTSWEYTFTREDYNTYYGDSHEDPGCIGAVVKIGDLDDRRNPEIGISPTYMENPCSRDSQ